MNIIPSSHSFNSVMPLQSAGELVNVLPDGSFVVEVDQRGLHCRKAVSCLLMPEIGDRVLVVNSDENQLWILAVLERQQADLPNHLCVTGDLHISAQEGKLVMSGTEQVAINSENLSVKAQTGNCHIDKMEYSGEQLSAWVSFTHLVGQNMESLWHTISQVSTSVFRKVKKTEHVQAGQIDLSAEDYARIHAKTTLVTSDNITKMDAEQIHVG